VALSALAANNARTRPRVRTDAAKIRKFIAETLSERERPKSTGDTTLGRLAAVSLPIEADT